MTVEPDDPMAKAKRLVLGFLPQDRQPKPEEVQNAVNAIFGMLAAQGEGLDRDQLAKEIEAMTAVFQERSSGLMDPKGHEPWLPEAKNDRDWDFWERYRRYLEDVANLPPWVVRRLDQSSDDVLSQLEDPRRAGSWSRKGLVIGQVQSGKTGQYIGLAAKAVDMRLSARRGAHRHPRRPPQPDPATDRRGTSGFRHSALQAVQRGRQVPAHRRGPDAGREEARHRLAHEQYRKG